MHAAAQPDRRLTLDGPEVGIVASALLEYSDACRMDAELAIGRDEQRRMQHLQRLQAAQALLRRIREAA